MKQYNKLIYSIIVILVLGIVAFLVVKNTNNRKIMNEPEKVVSDFYIYYLKDIYIKNDKIEHVEMKPNSSGTYQLDETHHLKFLVQSGYFSSTFHENEFPMFGVCNEALKKVTIKEVNDSGGFPSDFTNGACDFLTSYPWVGGQGEELNTVKILSSQVKENTAKVIAVIGDKNNNQVVRDYSYPTITLVKENGQWKINSINVLFAKP